MKIELGKGIDQLRFGMDEASVIEHFGEADKNYTEESGDRCMAYYEQNLALRFDREFSYRLTWVECHNTSAEFLGTKPFEIPSDSLTYLVEQRSAEEPEVFEMGWLTTLFYQDDWLELQFQFGKLSALNFGVFFGDQDDPHWPPNN